MWVKVIILYDCSTRLAPQDLLRRDILYYKGRLDMDQMQVVDVEDGKDKDFSVSVKNALKLCSPGGEEVHLLCAKKPEQKQRWLRAFADEREQVQHDLETGEQALRSTNKSIDLLSTVFKLIIFTVILHHLFSINKNWSKWQLEIIWWLNLQFPLVRR